MAEPINEKLEINEEEFERQFIEATERGKKFLAEAPKANSIKYDSKIKRLVLDLENGATLIIPPENVQGLRGASDTELAEVELLLENTTLHWEKLDVDFYVSSFMRGVFGTPKWMAELNSQSKNIRKELRKKVA